MESKKMQTTLKTYLIKASKAFIYVVTFIITFIRNIQLSFVLKAVLTAVLILFMMTVYSLQNADDVPLSKINDALQKETKIDKLEKCTDRQLMQFIGIDASDYDSFIYYKTKKALGVDELLIVKADSPGDLDGVRNAVDSRVSSQITTFDGYGPEQVALLKNAIITQRGDYLFYCVANGPEQYEEVFNNAV